MVLEANHSSKPSPDFVLSQLPQGPVKQSCLQTRAHNLAFCALDKALKLPRMVFSCARKVEQCVFHPHDLNDQQSSLSWSAQWAGVPFLLYLSWTSLQFVSMCHMGRRWRTPRECDVTGQSCFACFPHSVFVYLCGFPTVCKCPFFKGFLKQ